MSARSLLLALLLLGVQGKAQAQSVAECTSLAANRLSGAGAAPLGTRWRGFLVEGEGHALPLQFDQAGCVGVVAVAATEVQTFHLSLASSQGNTLVDTESDSRQAYLRFCGVRGLSLVAIADVMEGQGEVSLSAYQDAPEELPAGDATACFREPSGVETDTVVLGPAPDPLTVSRRVENAERFAGGFGYAEVWSRPLAGMEATDRAIPVAAGECYALHLAADHELRDLRLRVLGTSTAGPGFTRSGRNQQAAELWLSFCAEQAGVAIFQASADGRVLTLFRLPRQGPTPALVRGDARLPFRELSYLLHARGMHPRLIAVGMSGPGEDLRLPIALSKAGCYAFALSPTEDLVGDDLVMTLSDARGNLLARELRGADQPLVYHCSTAPEEVRLSARATSAEGRYLVWVGEADPGSSRSNPAVEH